MIGSFEQFARIVARNISPRLTASALFCRSSNPLGDPLLKLNRPAFNPAHARLALIFAHGLKQDFDFQDRYSGVLRDQFVCILARAGAFKQKLLLKRGSLTLRAEIAF